MGFQIFEAEDKKESCIETKINSAATDNNNEITKIEESSIYKELKEYRFNKSREEKVKPYFLYNNQEIEAIINAKPKTIEELKLIRGFGDVKCEKYGGDIIEIVNKY